MDEPGGEAGKTPLHSFASLRRDYGAGSLDSGGLAADPISQLGFWLDDARRAEIRDPGAMALATVDRQGWPDVRMVLLKGLDEGDILFFGSLDSAKAAQIAANPHVALVLFWPELERQVRVRAEARELGRKEVGEYFQSRPRGSQVAAWASPQSAVIADRGELEERYRVVGERFGESEIPLPARWGGWRAKPAAVEFWQGRPNRLHDRIRYRRAPRGWEIERLAP